MTHGSCNGLCRWDKTQDVAARLFGCFVVLVNICVPGGIDRGNQLIHDLAERLRIHGTTLRRRSMAFRHALK